MAFAQAKIIDLNAFQGYKAEGMEVTWTPGESLRIRAWMPIDLIMSIPSR
jgi:hypothetical protein